jgi:hypothetical protein
LTGNVSARATTAQDIIAKPSGRKFPVIPILIIAIIAATAVIAVKTLWPSVWPGSTAQVTQSPTPQTASPSPVAPGAERTLTYWITVRKNPMKFPGEAPRQVPGQVKMDFNQGDILHFSFTSPQACYLYIINESPPVSGQASNFYILFPTQTTNEFSSRIPVGKTLRFPDHNDGLILEESGTDQIWLIWSARELPELEQLKSWANPDDAGEIKNADQREKLRSFLIRHMVPMPQIDMDDKQTTLKTTGDIMVRLFELVHYL